MIESFPTGESLEEILMGVKPLESDLEEGESPKSVIDQAHKKLDERFPEQKQTIEGLLAVVEASKRPIKEMSETESKKD